MKTPFTNYTFPDATGNASFETVFQLEGPLLNPDQLDEAVQTRAPFNQRNTGF